jgi:hypothetical protein
MARFTKKLRQELVREFAERNGGWFDPAAFLAEVQEQGPAHPAFEWFEWDDDKAALEYRLDQARDFARGLIVQFEVRSMFRGSIRITTETAPLALSPLDRRRFGGGYYITDPNDPAHMAELCRQAAQSLRWFVSRYEGALRYAGISTASLDKIQAALEPQEDQEAA